jgi:phytoene dehydrogenase-like protein
VLLHHVFGEVNGKKGAWGHAIGGMGAITQAMAKRGAALGVEIRTGCAVREVLLEKGRATGVVTAKGERLDARVVVSNLNPRLLYTRLVDPAALPADFLRRMQGWRCGSGTFRMNVALSELPDFSCLPGRRRPSTTAAASSSRPACSTWSAPTTTRARTAGRANRSSSADSVDARPDPGAARPARGQPVLPARGAPAAGRIELGRRTANRWPT